MAALTAPRDTLERASGFSQLHAEVGLDSTQFYKGGIVVLEVSSGKFKKGVTAATGAIVAIGRCEETVLTGTSNTRKINVRSGIFKYGNSSAGDLIAATNIGQDCFIVDDQTVALTSNTGARCRAGEIHGVDSDGGVYVAFTFPLRS
jgi:hypothetical protein